jgi:hypothetical protein
MEYTDELGFSIIERVADFKDNGGYSFTLIFTPIKWWVRLLGRLKLLAPDPVVFEIYHESSGGEFVRMNVKSTKTGHEMAGVAFVRKGKRTLNVTFTPETIEKWDVELEIKRLVS